MEKKKKIVYRIEGFLKLNQGKQHFKKDIIETSERLARERVYTDFGSRQKLKRHMIEITNISTIKPKESKSLYVQQVMKGD